MRTLIFGIIVVLQIAGVSLAGEHVPDRSPEHRITIQQNAVETQHSNDAQNNQTPAQDPAIVVNQSGSAKHDEAEQQNSEEIRIQRQMLRVTWILAGAGILQFFILLVTFWIMRDTARRQLRAYVCIESAIVTFPEPNIPEALIEYKNSGQTPAYDVCGWIHTWFAAHPLKETLPPAPKNLMKGIAALMRKTQMQILVGTIERYS